MDTFGDGDDEGYLWGTQATVGELDKRISGEDEVSTELHMLLNQETGDKNYSFANIVNEENLTMNRCVSSMK